MAGAPWHRSLNAIREEWKCGSKQRGLAHSAFLLSSSSAVACEELEWKAGCNWQPKLTESIWCHRNGEGQELLLQLHGGKLNITWVFFLLRAFLKRLHGREMKVIPV